MERECVRKELEDKTYSLDVPVDIYVMINTWAVYYIGEGRLKHSLDGFELKNSDGKLDYRQDPEHSYCLNSDFYWYEKGDVVAKARLATEELYKILKGDKNGII